MRVREAERNGRADAQAGIDYLNTHHNYTFRDENGDVIESMYLGSILSLTPSGKAYMPWATSNLELCPRCKGAGCDFCGHLGYREAFLDQCYWEAFDARLEKHGCWRESGEGDPLDVHVQRRAADQNQTPETEIEAVA